MRFSRDKRGYENTFLVHSDRRRGKARSRILYWFRTPPGVKVGRSALDEDAIRIIEQNNPGIEFDWTRILKGAPEAESKPPAPFVERRQAPRAQARAPVAPRVPDKPAAPVEPPPPVVEPAPFDDIDAAFAEGDPTAEDVRGMPDVPATAAHARLGAEGVVRLRARYSEILARISERVPDPARQEELKSEADRLNPDTWVTDDEVRAGLEGYEAVFESLRSVVGRRRRRRRRGAEGS